MTQATVELAEIYALVQTTEPLHVIQVFVNMTIHATQIGSISIQTGVMDVNISVKNQMVEQKPVTTKTMNVTA